MKFATGIFSAAALLAVAGQVSAAPRQYRGSDTLEVFTKALVGACGSVNSGTKYPALATATPDFDYIGGGSTAGGSAMRDGTQDVAPMSRSLNQAEYCESTIEAGPQGEAALTIPAATPRSENWAVARDGLAIVTSQPNALRCDTDGITHADGLQGTEDDFGAPLAFNTTVSMPITDFPDDAAAPPAATYAFADWRDVLRVLWAGADHFRAAADGGLNGQTAANRVARCTSDVRRSLVANWDNIISGDTACSAVTDSCQVAAGTGAPLRHIFRRDDASGTTDTFLTLLQLNSVGGSLSAGTIGVNEPFCNGKDTVDADPIRVRCSINNPIVTAPISSSATQLNDETCGVDQTTGLVMAIRVPSLVGTTNTLTSAGNRQEPVAADLYPSVNCATGSFAVRRPPAAFDSTQSCPDGAPYLFTGCLTPLAPVGDASDCSCINAWTNRAPGTPDKNPGIGGLQNDGRVWNRIIRGPRAPFRTGANVCPVLRDERGDQAVLADGRMRYRATTVNSLAVPATRVCLEFDATRAIGCLSRAAECSIGFAGREAIIDRPATVTPPQPAYDGGTALLVGPGAAGGTPQGPSETQIFASTATAGYQLARKLYFNSITGINAIFPVGTSFTTTGSATVTGSGERLPTAAGETGSLEQAQLMQCLLTEDPSVVTSPMQVALAASGFLPLSAGSAAPFIDTSVARTCP